ncbi:MAG: sugar ABC transporter substrate-binding protein [bacterium]
MRSKQFLMVLLQTGLLLLACQRGAKNSTDGPTVALVMKTLNNPFFIDMQKGAEEAAKRLGVNLVIQAPEREIDVEKQMQIAENLIQRKVDAICITPSGSKEIVPAIVKANRNNIPVLIVDTQVDERTLVGAGGKTATFIGSDNVEGGRLAGEYIAKALHGNGKVAVLEGIPGHETGDQRLKGFHQAVDKIAGIQVVASQTANWERDQGFNVFQNILQSHPDVQALFACNDMMALGAVEAIAAAGKTGSLLVVGFDAVRDARQAIDRGEMAASIQQHPEEMGRLAIEKAVELIHGKPIPPFIATNIGLITQDSAGGAP